MSLRDLPNILSILRIVLVFPVVLSLVDERYLLALLLFGVAGLTDGLDGFLAKRFGWVTRLGSILDPLADKLLLVSSYLALAWLGHIPAWLVSGVIVRDIIIVVGSIAYHFEVEEFSAAPSLLSKANTLAQILLVLLVVFHHGIFTLPEPIVHGMIYVVLFTTVASGIDYILTWGRRALRAKRQKD